jgi:HSP20 family protein
MSRFNPLRRDLSASLQSLQTDLNRLFEDFWNPTRVGPAPTSTAEVERAAWSPAIDLYESPEEFVLLADIPGVDPASIDLSVTGNVLSLRGMKPGFENPSGHALAQERHAGSFYRQVILSSEVNFDATQAEARNGVLRVRLPKQEAAKPRTIPIQPK